MSNPDPDRLDQASEADLAEQETPLGEEQPGITEPSVDLDQADEADILEQGAEVGDDEDDYRHG